MAMNRAAALGLLIAGLTSWYAPGFNGFWSAPSEVTDGEGRIVGAIFLVGALLLWFQRP